VSAVHNGCVTCNFHVTSKQKGTVGKNGTIWRPVPWDNSLKNGMIPLKTGCVVTLGLQLVIPAWQTQTCEVYNVKLQNGGCMKQ
jgi:hypothetical protein